MAGENKILFREKQRFTQFWLWIVLLGVALIFWIGFFYQVVGGGAYGSRPVSDVQLVILFVLMGIGLPWFFYKMSLTTEVTPDMVQVQFFPFHLKPIQIPLHLIRDFKHVTYNPIMEYGGWGIRWSFNGKAYNTTGNEGVKLYFYNKRPLLIGSQRANELADAILHAKRLSESSAG
jgi:hypothetical protein